MDAVSKAIKLNIQQHFERWTGKTRSCEDCPFCDECEIFIGDETGRAKYLCEIITGKDFGDMAGLRAEEMPC